MSEHTSENNQKKTVLALQRRIAAYPARMEAFLSQIAALPPMPEAETITEGNIRRENSRLLTELSARRAATSLALAIGQDLAGDIAKSLSQAESCLNQAEITGQMRESLRLSAQQCQQLAAAVDSQNRRCRKDGKALSAFITSLKNADALHDAALLSELKAFLAKERSGDST